MTPLQRSETDHLAHAQCSRRVAVLRYAGHARTCDKNTAGRYMFPVNFSTSSSACSPQRLAQRQAHSLGLNVLNRGCDLGLDSSIGRCELLGITQVVRAASAQPARAA